MSAGRVRTIQKALKCLRPYPRVLTGGTPKPFFSSTRDPSGRVSRFPQLGGTQERATTRQQCPVQIRKSWGPVTIVQAQGVDRQRSVNMNDPAMRGRNPSLSHYAWG
jgi:hypothetical protein